MNTLYRIAAHEQRLSRDDADLLVEQLADLRNEIDVNRRFAFDCPQHLIW